MSLTKHININNDKNTLPFFFEKGIKMDEETRITEMYIGGPVESTSTIKRSCLLGDITETILEMISGANIAYGIDENGKPVVEYHVTDKKGNEKIIALADVQENSENGKWLNAGVYDISKKTMTANKAPLFNAENGETVHPFIVAYIVSMLTVVSEKMDRINEHFLEQIPVIAKAIKAKSFEENDFAALAIASNEVYTTMVSGYIWSSLEVGSVPALKMKEVSSFAASEIEGNNLSAFKNHCVEKMPEFVLFNDDEQENVATGFGKKLNYGAARKIKEFKEFAEETAKNLTEEEKELIPVIPEAYPVEKEALEIAYNVCNYKKIGMMNAADSILRGEPGSGKTTAAKMVAGLLGLPYLVLSCSAGSDELTVLGGVLPKTEDDDHDGIVGWQAKTTVKEILFEPELAYQKLTGATIQGISSEQVFQWIVTNTALLKQDNKFEAVASPLVKALSRGWLVEVQEPTLIMNPGVLPKLNSFLEDNVIVTDSGATYTRNGGVCIITTNVNCAGCTPLNASVQSRFTHVYEMDLPSQQQLKSRIKAELKFKEDAVLKLMIRCVTDINNYLNNNMIYDGAAGYRELRNWVLAYMYDIAVKGDGYESAISTVINKATSQIEYKEDLLNILKKYFSS